MKGRIFLLVSIVCGVAVAIATDDVMAALGPEGIRIALIFIGVLLVAVFVAGFFLLNSLVQAKIIQGAVNNDDKNDLRQLAAVAKAMNVGGGVHVIQPGTPQAMLPDGMNILDAHSLDGKKVEV